MGRRAPRGHGPFRGSTSLYGLVNPKTGEIAAGHAVGRGVGSLFSPEDRCPKKVQLDEKEHARLTGMLAFELDCYRKGYQKIAGLDEAGRGPLAGPVVAGAVVLPPESRIAGLDDSKRLTPSERDLLYKAIFENALDIGIGIVDHDVIDRINILQATRVAMHQALNNLKVSPDFLLIDALTLPTVQVKQKAIVKGDQKSLSIAAASIVAKVTRDRIMRGYHEQYPEYGFHSHKGYGTREHLRNIRLFGPCHIHRKTFRGVQIGLFNP